MKNPVLNKSQRAEINSLFENESDAKALKKLYEYTENALVGTLIRWLENEEIKFDICNDNTPNNMFEDLIEYIYKYYNLDNY